MIESEKSWEKLSKLDAMEDGKIRQNEIEKF
jgi:hypothetical protein